MYSELLKYYKEPHRKYHTMEHIDSMMSYKPWNLEQQLTILFHDIVYNPHSKNNEEDSIKLFEELTIDIPELKDIDRKFIHKAILATKHPFDTHEPLIQEIIDADLSIFYSPLSKFMEYEKGIFFEYQKYDIDTYVEERIKFLEKAISFFSSKNTNNKPSLNIIFLIDYLQTKKFKIGIYPGSFNPLHKGHKDIINQAEKIFDKVIIAKGKNQDKIHLEDKHPISLPNQIDTYSNTLYSYMNSLNKDRADYTIIRGLRNGFDLNYEDSLRAVVKDHDKSIDFMYFFCNKKYEHISSSMIRSLYSFGEDEYKRYLC